VPQNSGPGKGHLGLDDMEVGVAHPTCIDLNENFAVTWSWNGDVLNDESRRVVVQDRCPHACSLDRPPNSLLGAGEF
jgi:hypothetical protein